MNHTTSWECSSTVSNLLVLHLMNVFNALATVTVLMAGLNISKRRSACYRTVPTCSPVHSKPHVCNETYTCAILYMHYVLCTLIFHIRVRIIYCTTSGPLHEPATVCPPPPPPRQVLEVVSAIKEQDQYELAEQIYANTCQLFGW